MLAPVAGSFLGCADQGPSSLPPNVSRSSVSTCASPCTRTCELTSPSGGSVQAERLCSSLSGAGTRQLNAWASAADHGQGNLGAHVKHRLHGHATNRGRWITSSQQHLLHSNSAPCLLAGAVLRSRQGARRLGGVMRSGRPSAPRRADPLPPEPAAACCGTPGTYWLSQSRPAGTRAELPVTARPDHQALQPRDSFRLV